MFGKVASPAILWRDGIYKRHVSFEESPMTVRRNAAINVITVELMFRYQFNNSDIIKYPYVHTYVHTSIAFIIPGELRISDNKDPNLSRYL